MSRSPSRRGTRPEFHVDFDRGAVQEPPPPEPAVSRELTLTVINGSAEQPVYTLTLDRINIGRCAEVRDSRNRLHPHEPRRVHAMAPDRSTRPCPARHAHIDCDEEPATIACSTTAARTARLSCGMARRSASPPARAAFVCCQAMRSSSARRDSAFVDPRDLEHTTSVSCLARRHRDRVDSLRRRTVRRHPTEPPCHSVLATLERSSWRPAASS